MEDGRQHWKRAGWEAGETRDGEDMSKGSWRGILVGSQRLPGVLISLEVFLSQCPLSRRTLLLGITSRHSGTVLVSTKMLRLPLFAALTRHNGKHCGPRAAH